MDAVLGVFATVAGVAGPILGMIGKGFSFAGETLARFSLAIFIAGFVGLLLAFLWFFFRYLDRKKLTLPTLVFTFFFLLFLSGNILLIARGEDTFGETSATTEQRAEAAAPADASAV